MKKYLRIIPILLTLLIKSFTAHSNVITVGGPECDYQDIQSAINDVIFADVTINLTQQVFEGGINIDTSASNEDVTMELVGGFASCTHAQGNIREFGSQSTIDGQDINFGLKVTHNESSQFTLTMKGIKIINGQYLPEVTYAGGIHLDGQILFNFFESEISDSSGFNGGGIYANELTFLHLESTYLLNNKALNGGGLFCRSCTLILNTNTGVSHNQAFNAGGGIYADNNSDTYIYSGSANPQENNKGIYNNQAIDGGGIYLEHSDLFIIGSYDSSGVVIFGNQIDPASLTKNSAQNNGGGIYATNNSSIAMNQFLIQENEAIKAGGGVYISEGTFLKAQTFDLDCWHNKQSKCSQFLNNRIVNGSETNGSGGAIKVNRAKLSVKQTWFEGNDAGGSGFGSVLSSINGVFETEIENSVFYKNGYVTGSDLNIIHAATTKIKLQHITAVDNTFNASLLFTYGSPAYAFYPFKVFNSILHNTNGGEVLQVIQHPDVEFGCVFMHEGAIPPTLSVDVFTGVPVFEDRDNALFNLTDASHTLIDRCPQRELIDSQQIDLLNNERFVDLDGFPNLFGALDYADIGAIEFDGFDDIIFTNSFE